MELFAKRMTWELDNDEGLSCLSFELEDGYLSLIHILPEKIGVSAIAMPESEYGQIKLGFDAVNKKKNFTPVKLGNASRLIEQPDKGFYGAQNETYIEGWEEKT